jgi:hypothetical protein
MAFMLALGGVVGLLGPKLLESIAGKFTERLGKRIWGVLRGGKEGQLKRELIRALTSGNIEPILTKYADKLTPEEISRLRSIARLRNLFQNLEDTINNQIYTEERATDFIETTKILEDAALDLDFEDAGIKSIKVKDNETGEELPITSNTYLVALFLRFAAAVRSQIARTSTPDQTGWALEYGQEVQVKLEKVKMEEALPSAALKMGRGRAADFGLLDPDFHAFREAYERLMPSYQQAILIRDKYLNTVACLRAAQQRIDSIPSNNPIHQTMTVQYLDALAQGLRGEAQYWLFHSSPNLHQDAITLQHTITNDRAVAEQYLQRLNVTQAETNLLLDCLKLYRHFNEGLAGAHQLFKQASIQIKKGENAQHIQRRIQELNEAASSTPLIHVDDPPPII